MKIKLYLGKKNLRQNKRLKRQTGIIYAMYSLILLYYSVGRQLGLLKRHSSVVFRNNSFKMKESYINIEIVDITFRNLKSLLQ